MVYYYAVSIMPQDNTIRPEPAQIGVLIEAWRDAGYIVRPGSAAHREMYRDKPDHPGVETGAWYFPFDSAGYVPESPTASLGAMWRWLTGATPRTCLGRMPGRPFPISPDAEALAYLASTDAAIHFADSANRNEFGILDPLGSYPDERHIYHFHLQINIHDNFVDTTCYNIPGLSNTECKCGHELRFDEDRVRRTCPLCGLGFRPQDQFVPIGDWTGNETLVAGGACHRFEIVVDCAAVYDSGDPPAAQFEKNAKASGAFIEICRAALGIELYEVTSYFES
jgi:hypothetical protein